MKEDYDYKPCLFPNLIKLKLITIEFSSISLICVTWRLLMCKLYNIISFYKRKKKNKKIVLKVLFICEKKKFPTFFDMSTKYPRHSWILRIFLDIFRTVQKKYFFFPDYLCQDFKMWTISWKCRQCNKHYHPCGYPNIWSQTKVAWLVHNAIRYDDSLLTVLV